MLYLAVQQSLLGPINGDLQQDASRVSAQWQTGVYTPLNEPCPEEQGPDLLVACYSPQARLLWPPNSYARIGGVSEFYNDSLASALVSGGSASDTITTGGPGDFGSIQRYATAVPNPNGGGVLGIVVVGLPIGYQASTLATLLQLLLLLGGLTILLSLGAGLFLANRALQPARIAYARQRDFLADASHELRTPLTMLRSSVEFVLRGREHLPPDDIALLEDTVAETTHLTSLANKMLSLARLDSDEFHVDEDIVDMNEITAEVGRWAEPLATERELTLEVKRGESALVLGDRSLLEQATLVLVDNAIKYNGAGGTVTMGVEATDGHVQIEISDTGIGVAAEHLRRLGERFYRVDKARSRESGGAGLGLSIVRSIVARHEGLFSIESAPGVGTTATITLPLVGSRKAVVGSR